jgi:hypothetical protein
MPITLEGLTETCKRNRELIESLEVNEYLRLDLSSDDGEKFTYIITSPKLIQAVRDYNTRREQA